MFLGSPESNVTVVPTNQGCLKFSDPEGKGKPSDNYLRETNVEKWYSQKKVTMRLLNSFIYEVVVPENTQISR